MSLRAMQLVQLRTPEQYEARSRVTQFISTNLNIGNIMPVYAIQEMLGEVTDVWNIHRPIDWDLVNSSYESAIIGGAGLLHKVFEPFWADFLANCKLPFVIWGVGLCALDASEASFCDPQIASQVFDRALAVNVRDELTADTYGFGRRSEISVTECPTVFYLRDFEVRPVQQRATLVIHPGLVSDENHEKARRHLEFAGFEVRSTLNVASSEDQIPDLIRENYCSSSLVVSSRLHGVITAYALGIPYIALAGDEKLREFHRLFGGGMLINNVDELAAALEDPLTKLAPGGEPPTKPDLTKIEDFARLAAALLSQAQYK